MDASTNAPRTTIEPSTMANIQRVRVRRLCLLVLFLFVAISSEGM